MFQKLKKYWKKGNFDHCKTSTRKKYKIILSFACMHAKALQSCPILCDPMDCSPPGFSVHEILQTRILEWVAMASSRGSSQPRN